MGGSDYGEADRIVHIVSARGRVSCFAPSARKSRKRYGAGLQVFTTIKFEVGRRRSAGLPILSSIEVLRGRWGLSADLDRLALASYACELIDHVAAEGVETGLPEHLERVLDETMIRGPSAALRRAFELAVLAELGFAPDLGECPQCGLPAAFLDVVRGGLFCRNHRGRGKEIGPKTRAWLEAMLRDPNEGPFGPLAADEAERAATALSRPLDEAILHTVGRPLSSLALLAPTALPPQKG